MVALCHWSWPTELSLSEVHSPHSPFTWSVLSQFVLSFTAFECLFLAEEQGLCSDAIHPCVPSSQPPLQSLELLNTHMDFHQIWQSSRAFTSSCCSCHQNWQQQQREAGWGGASRRAPGGLCGTSSLEQTPGCVLPSAAGQAEVLTSAKEMCGE